MAYQNIGKPRFYVSILQWLKSLGKLTAHQWGWGGAQMSIIDINPTRQHKFIGYDEGYSLGHIFYSHAGSFSTMMPNKKNFCMLLGHNFSGTRCRIGKTYTVFVATQELINYDYQTPTYNGFSIGIGDDAHIVNVDTFTLFFSNYLNINPTGFEYKIGSILYGTYYDMPNAPNLSLTMSREYGGTKEFTTYSGSSMSNTMWSKAPNWGDLGAWEFDGGNPTFSRSGRRSWDLEFSYMDDSNLWGSNQSLSFITNTTLGYEADNDISYYSNSILSDNNMSNYYTGASDLGFDSFSSSSPDSFTGQHVQSVINDYWLDNSYASTHTPTGFTTGDLQITEGVQYKVSFNLEATSGTLPTEYPLRFALSRVVGGSGQTVEPAQEATDGYNEFVFTSNYTSSANNSATWASVGFVILGNQPTVTILVTDVKCEPVFNTFNYNLLTDDNFFSQVWHKTLGGTLPFIFQPDSSNNNPDQFAICKFKDNSLEATQSAHNVYDIKLSIEEVW